MFLCLTVLLSVKKVSVGLSVLLLLPRYVADLILVAAGGFYSRYSVSEAKLRLAGCKDYTAEATHTVIKSLK